MQQCTEDAQLQLTQENTGKGRSLSCSCASELSCIPRRYNSNQRALSPFMALQVIVCYGLTNEVMQLVILFANLSSKSLIPYAFV